MAGFGLTETKMNTTPAAPALPGWCPAPFPIKVSPPTSSGCPHLLITSSVALSPSTPPRGSCLSSTYLTSIHPSEPWARGLPVVEASLSLLLQDAISRPTVVQYPKSPLFLELLLNMHIWIHFYACLVRDKRLQSGTVYHKGFIHSGRHGGCRHKNQCQSANCSFKFLWMDLKKPRSAGRAPGLPTWTECCCSEWPNPAEARVSICVWQ